MKYIRHSAIIAAVLCGSTATAEVTAQQVWDNWTDQMEVYGQASPQVVKICLVTH